MERKPGIGRGVLRAQRGASVFTVTRFQPSPEIADVIEHFWTVRWDLRGKPAYTQVNLPGPAITLSFERSQSQLWGPSSKRFVKVLEGKSHVFAAQFLPGGLKRFWDGDIASLREQRCTVESIFPLKTQTMVEALLDTNDETSENNSPPNESPKERAERERRDGVTAASFDRVMCELARHAVDANELGLVQRVCRALTVDRELNTVQAAATREGISVRTLQRLFHRYVGYSPKWILQRGRLQDAAELLAVEDVQLSVLALDLGYSDQAHFARAFKAQIGQTPTEFVRSARVLS